MSGRERRTHERTNRERPICAKSGWSAGPDPDRSHFSAWSWLCWGIGPGPFGEPAALLSYPSGCHPFVRHAGPGHAGPIHSSRRLFGGLRQQQPWATPVPSEGARPYLDDGARSVSMTCRPAGVLAHQRVGVEMEVSYSGADDPPPPLVREAVPLTTRRSTRTDDDRPPNCPICRRRLVILTTHIDRTRNEPGQRHRYQLWGCPRGHATSRRLDGAFTAVEVLPDPLRQDDSYRLGESVQASLTRPGDGQMRGAGQLR